MRMTGRSSFLMVVLTLIAAASLLSNPITDLSQFAGTTTYYSDGTYLEEVGERSINCAGQHNSWGTTSGYALVTDFYGCGGSGEGCSDPQYSNWCQVDGWVYFCCAG